MVEIPFASEIQTEIGLQPAGFKADPQPMISLPAKEMSDSAFGFEKLGQVVCSITHDLNNLIHVVSGFSTILEQDDGLTPGQREKARNIREAAESAGALVSQFRTVFEPQPPRMELLDVREALRTSLSLAKGFLDPRFELRSRFSLGFSGVIGDRHRLIHAFLNCLLNARDAMPVGGRITVVSFRLAERGTAPVAGGGRKTLVVCIRDTGTGMTDEVRRRLFEPYFTTKGKHGTGLGMQNVLNTMRVHGGGIEVESAPGLGSTFRLYFPLADAGLDS